ncbi:hypothetical protein [Terribacillus halophilus]|uniref:hypothetical protein n=1 Tax=Terribacillus halophilus TaxID=361279 RepID=UPI0009862D4C|nr:hypothetical protein [Terribacillus halophilus]
MRNGKESLSPSDMDPNDLPDVPAFQDEITRDYLESTEPVREGYYPFISGSNSFTFDFPEEMVVDETSIVGNEANSESLIFYYDDNNAEVMDEYTIHYLSSMSDVESSKDVMNKSAGIELDFKSVDTDNEGQYMEVAEVESDDSSLSLAALIWNDDKQEIQVFTEIICRNDIEAQQCNSLKEDERKKVTAVMKSIKFKDNKGK